MIQPYLFALVLLCVAAVAAPTVPTLPIDGNYPYGVKLDYDPGSPTDRNETVTIYQNGTKHYTLNDYDIRMIYRDDLDGDGYEEAILRTFSGEAHCCFRLVFLKFAPDMPKPKIYDWGNTEYVTLKDLDGDKRPEIITWDDSYSYGFGLSFAESVSVKVILRYRSHTLHPDANLTKTYAPVAVKMPVPVKVSVNERGFLKYDGSVRDIMKYGLYLFYIGKTKEATSFLSRYLRFEHPAVKKLFVDELVDMMAQSPFWDDIRHINGWYDSGLCEEVEGKIVCPEELYGKLDIAVWLFERL